MKKFNSVGLIAFSIFACSFACPGVAKADVTLNCKAQGQDYTMVLKVQGDQPGNTISENANQEGSSYGEDGSFQGFEAHGTKAVYTLEDATVIAIDESLVYGSATQGTAEVRVTGFVGGPGEAGWDASTTDFTCTK